MDRSRTRKKTNILFVLLQLRAGGSERVVLDLARNLDVSLFDVYVAYFDGGALYASFRDACCNLFRVHKNGRLDFTAVGRIAQIVRENGIDVINAHHYMPFLYSYPGSKLLNRVGLIYTEHSVPEVVGITGGVHSKLCKLMFPGTDSIVGVSDEISDTFTKGFPAHSKKIVSIPNGVDVEKFAMVHDRDQLRREWGFTAEHFVVGTVANFRNVKNHACLVRAFHRLSTQYLQMRLLLVGSGCSWDPENSQGHVMRLLQSYDLTDRVILAGYREDIPDCLHCIDAFCLPSFSEGLPVSILEAMAAGIPVVGSHVRGIKEVVSAEETGLLFPSDNDAALAHALERLIRDEHLRRRLRDNAFAFVSQRHGIKQWVSKYENLFHLVSPPHL